MNTDLTKIYNKHKGMWIALDDKLSHVISFSNSAKKTYNEAVKKGSKLPILFKVPKENIPYFGKCLYDRA
ncbi:MAG: DUF5678 domain-containing protein [Candidatus Roizmanbacteria bacterium]|nr:DUF5678 domain-containing protein [Candidatus Roizmanbacteria bacterium]